MDSGQGCPLLRSSVDPPVPFADSSAMSSVAEIEAAIERLAPAQVNEVAAWLEEYQQMINASAQMFSIYDQEERDHAKG